MNKLLMAFILCLSLGIVTSCGLDGGSKKDLVIYSEVEPKYTEALLEAYNEQYKKTKNFQRAKAIYELTDKVEKPDLVIASSRTLNGLKIDKALKPSECKASKLLPASFKDQEKYWTGAFYDPVVFVINQNFAKKVGQDKLNSWNDLENLKEVRYAVENLNNSAGSMSLLAGMASHMGEEAAMSYMWNLNHNVTAYGKFPFSPIRMVATGEADMTVTVMSMVARYVDAKFPAYFVHPSEGAPANLYGVAVFKDSESTFSNQQFMDWLIADVHPKMITLSQDAGYMFLLPGGEKKPPVDPDKLWLNTNYLTLPKLQALADQWIEKVRFSHNQRIEK